MSDNELIAEFMGEEISAVVANPGVPVRVLVLPRKPVSEFKTGRPIEIKYDTSWDWLMPVVEKIESLHDYSYLCRIVSRRCVIYDSNTATQASVYQSSGEGIISASVNQDTKLIACHKAVVEFIKWYNTQTK